MNFLVKRTSDRQWFQIIKLNSLEELTCMQKECNCELIIGLNTLYQWEIEKIIRTLKRTTAKDAEIISSIEYCIEIYDDFRE